MVDPSIGNMQKILLKHLDSQERFSKSTYKGNVEQCREIEAKNVWLLPLLPEATAEKVGPKVASILLCRTDQRMTEHRCNIRNAVQTNHHSDP